MKNSLFILVLGAWLLSSCSASRTGYTYYDDVYNNRPSYSEPKRTSTYMDDQSSYPSSNYNQSDYQTSQYNNTYDDNRIYNDDENQNSRVYENYTERLRRFGGASSGFDYYSPYYTGFYDGINYGSGISMSIGINSFGRYSSSLWNPFFGTSFSFGFGRAYGGLNSLYNPFYYDPFYYPSYSLLGYRNLFYDPFYSPYYYGIGYPYYSYGRGINYNYIYSGSDVNRPSKNVYYGPRGGSYNNQYYDGNQYDGGKVNNSRGNVSGSTPDSRYKGGNMQYTPKNNGTINTPPTSSPTNRKAQPSRPGNMPERYNVPRNGNQPSNLPPAKREVAPAVPRNNVPQRYNNTQSTPKSVAPVAPKKSAKKSASKETYTPERYNNNSNGFFNTNSSRSSFDTNFGTQRNSRGSFNSGGSFGSGSSSGSGGSMKRTNK